MAAAENSADGERGTSGAAMLASFKRNIVAIISLVVALSGLGYNTWRNEATEAHRNVRQGAFAMLEQLGQLQQLVDQRFYADKKDDVNRISSWGKVTLVRDTAPLVSRAAQEKADQLFKVWSEQLDAMDEGDAAAEKQISDQIAALRAQLLADLRALR
jgi:hypothetical protein